jgi:HD-like signal output (HDOD) protein/CheY-like chemotaxis protein
MIAKASQGRVLVVDDEEPVRVALGRTLRRLGYEILEANHGEGGLATVAAHDPDIIILDLRMPGMDGHTFMQRLQAAGYRSLPRVIVMSGQGNIEDVIKILRWGAVDFLRKPWNLTELMSAVTRAIELKRQDRLPTAAPADPAAPTATPNEKRASRFTALQAKLRQGEIVLPTIPSLLDQLRTQIEDPKSSIDHIAETVERDSRMAADMLRMANSAQFSHMPRATNTKTAVTRLGLKHVGNLVRTIFLQGLCNVRTGPYRELLTVVWRRSVARGVSMRALCDLLDPSTGVDGDTAYLIGLMADVGATLLFWVISERASDNLTSEDVSDTATALEMVKRTHEEVGKAMVERWNLGKALPATVAQHHREVPPVCDAVWWNLFVLGDFLASKMVEEPDPTTDRKLSETTIDRCAAEFGIPRVVMNQLSLDLRAEYESIEGCLT